MHYSSKKTGFTLIELVIGIVVLSLSFLVIFQMILPAATQSATQTHQIRAAELGQSIMSEIMGKAFDENSDMMGGFTRCGEDMDEDGNNDDLCSNAIGNEEGNDRALFDDVDDYDGYNILGDAINDTSAEVLSNIYKGFTVNISVIHDSNYDGDDDFDGVDDQIVKADENVIAKLIKVTVISAEGVAITFSSYKANF